MMKPTFAFVFCLLFLVGFTVHSFSQSEDVAGWQETRWGMSETEILEKFKTQLVKLPKRLELHDAYVDYSIPDYKIENRVFTVFFDMHKETGKLKQVRIRDDVSKSLVSQDVFFPSYESLLTRKYGKPRFNKDQRDRSMVSLERQWIFPTTTISLTYFWSGLDELSYLTIRYFPSESGDVNKI